MLPPIVRSLLIPTTQPKTFPFKFSGKAHTPCCKAGRSLYINVYLQPYPLSSSDSVFFWWSVAARTLTLPTTTTTTTHNLQIFLGPTPFSRSLSLPLRNTSTLIHGSAFVAHLPGSFSVSSSLSSSSGFRVPSAHTRLRRVSLLSSHVRRENFISPCRREPGVSTIFHFPRIPIHTQVRYELCLWFSWLTHASIGYLCTMEHNRSRAIQRFEARANIF